MTANRPGIANLVILLVAIGCLHAGNAAAATIHGTIRDFSETHIDFEDGIGVDPGIVESLLDGDGKPVYAGGAGTVTTHGQAAFDQWYRDTAGINLSAPATLDLVWSEGQAAYVFDDPAYFPIDGQLLGNTPGYGHNYHFTLEFVALFDYDGTFSLEVGTDDDVWVFVDGLLAIDGGGVQPTTSRYLAIDSNNEATFGMEAGNTYQLAIFLAERHTTVSSLRVTSVVPLYQDADGDGLSDDVELALGTDPELTDTDGDGIPDYDETDGGTAVDTDLDGTIDALDLDSDDDGLSDEQESTGDPDGDGVPNFRDLDSDDDGFTDDVETLAGSDPYDPGSTPQTILGPRIAAIADVGCDQGHRVRISWQASGGDVAGSMEPVLSYSIYRRIDGFKTAADPEGDTLAAGGWDFVLNLPASADSSYNALAETLCDSTVAGLCWSVFFVRAHTAVPAVYHDSAPDSGYSVDNLAPSVPENLLLASGQLGWDECPDADFDYFTIYGAETPDLPGATAIGHTTGTSFDARGLVWSYFLVTATDFAGNEGAAAVTAGVTGVAETPASFRLLGAAPNPFNPRTTIRYDLPRDGRVSLRVYDLSGRLTRTLMDGDEVSAGRREAVWDGRNETGRQVAAGIYFCRLEAGAYIETKRMTLIR